MKEETNESTTAQFPNEGQMNDMHKNAWLGFYVDAQEAKKEIDTRYGKMVNHFGSYRKMPPQMKEMFKTDYSRHDSRWGENGEEQQKRFGVKAPEPQPEYKSLIDEKEQFLQKAQTQREKQKSRKPELDR